MIERGGKNQERLYLYDLDFRYDSNKPVSVKKTDMPDIDNIIDRHKKRYFLPAFFVRQGMRVLDFPCGSGYGYEIMGGKGIIYDGVDNDPITIAYARKMYCNSEKVFREGDFLKPPLKKGFYDVVACIEGLEHLEKEYQRDFVNWLKMASTEHGVTVISTPLVEESGPSKTNEFHKYELNEKDFMELLLSVFDDVEIIKTKDKLHDGRIAVCAYGICRKKGE